MTDDIVDRLRIAVELVDSRSFTAEAIGDAITIIGAADRSIAEQANEIERLRTALQKIYNIWDGTGYADLCEGACGNLMFGVAKSALKGTP